MNVSFLIHKHSGLIAGLVLIAAGILVYANSFSGAFVFDDEKSIVLNPRIKQLWPPWEAMKAPPEIALRDRPVVSLTLAINDALGGLDVWGYHAFNLSVHILAALILFGIVRRTLLNPVLRSRYGDAATSLAFSATLLWLVHPLQTESVTYIIQRSESLCGLFYLLTLYCFIRGSDSRFRNRAWYAFSVIFCALGMGTKAVMVTAPLMVLAYDSIFVSLSIRKALKERRGWYLFLFATWLIQLALVVSTSYADIKTYSPFQYAVSQFGVIAHYLRLSIWPYPLCLDYGWEVPRTIAGVVPPALLILGLLGATIWALLRKPALGFLGLWFFLILAPTSSILPLEDLAFEHRMYLPLAAVLLSITLTGYELLCLLFRRDRSLRKVAQSFLVLMIALLLGMVTSARNRDYHSPVEIWSQVTARRPRNPRAFYNLAESWGKQKEKKDVIAYYREALRLDPYYAEAMVNLGIALAEQGQLEEAVSHFRKALFIKPDLDQAHVNLAQALILQGNFEESVSHYEAALRLQPSSSELHLRLGVAYGRTKQYSRSIEHFRKAVILQPDNYQAHLNLGIALARSGRIRESEEELIRTLSLNPNSAEVHFNLGKLFSEQGNPQKAVEHYSRAIELKPDFEDAYHNRAFSLNKLRHFAEAIRDLKEGLQNCPESLKLANHLAWLLATSPEKELRDGNESIELAQKACLATDNQNPLFLDTLAAANAASGNFARASDIARKALAIAREKGNEDLARTIELRLRLYNDKRPYIEADRNSPENDLM